MQIDYAGKITKEEYLLAMKAITTNTRKVLRWVIGISFLFTLSYLPCLSDHESHVYMLPFTMFTFFCFLLSLYIYVFQRSLAARRMDHPSNLYRDTVTGYLSEDELVVRFKEMKSSFLWDGFTDYTLKQNVLVLYRSRNSFLLFSQTMFAGPEDWQNCITLVTQKLAAAKKLQREYRISL